MEERSVVGKLRVGGGALCGATRRLAVCRPQVRSTGPAVLTSSLLRRSTAASKAGSRLILDTSPSSQNHFSICERASISYLHCLRCIVSSDSWFDPVKDVSAYRTLISSGAMDLICWTHSCSISDCKRPNLTSILSGSPGSLLRAL